MTLRQTGQVTMVMFTLVPQFGHIREFRDAHTGHPMPSGGRREPQWMQKTGLSRAGGCGGTGGGSRGLSISGTRGGGW